MKIKILLVVALCFASLALAQDSSNVRTIGYCGTPHWAKDVAVSGSYAYVADSDSGLRIINISDPAAPTHAGTFVTPGWADGVVVYGSYAYVANEYSGLRIINISDPADHQHQRSGRANRGRLLRYA